MFRLDGQALLVFVCYRAGKTSLESLGSVGAHSLILRISNYKTWLSIKLLDNVVQMRKDPTLKVENIGFIWLRICEKIPC